jgi:hypothetical protein
MIGKFRIFIAILSLAGGVVLAFLILRDYLQGNFDDIFVVFYLSIFLLGCMRWSRKAAHFLA